MNGGGLGEQYKTAQFHFHWGGDSAVGSEHVYNGKSYPIEVLFIWWYQFSLFFHTITSKNLGIVKQGEKNEI